MSNQIRNVAIVNHRLDPNETELHLLVEVEQLTPGTEVKGRLMGPRNAYTTTVEVAYSWKEVSRTDRIILRAIIPEPSCWTPKNPFLYQGPVQLWQDGQLWQEVQLSHGIRWLQLTAKGLKLNGQSFVLRGKIAEPASIDNKQALQWHHAGINTLITGFPADAGEIWRLADQYGFLTLEDGSWSLSVWLHDHSAWNRHPSALGGIAHPSGGLDPTILKLIHPLLMGIRYAGEPVPAGAAFVVCKEEELKALEGMDVPKLVLTDSLPASLPEIPGVIGWITT